MDYKTEQDLAKTFFNFNTHNLLDLEVPISFLKIERHHEPDCALVRASSCTTAIECEHGFDVCPKCDPCSCDNTKHYRHYYQEVQKQSCIGCDFEKKITTSMEQEVFKKQAEALDDLIKKGMVNPETDLDALVEQGLSAGSIEYWRQHYGQKKTVSEGMLCCRCKEFYPYANGPNQTDGTFKCYGCRI